MTPRQLAQRIAAMDWSAVSLQHLLAVTAAVETLNSLESPVQDAPSNIVPFRTFPAPLVLPAIRTVRLLHLDGREWCSAGFMGPSDAWGWIVETVAAEWGVNEDAIGCLESEDGGGDLVTVDGIPCYRIAHGHPPRVI